MRSSEVEYAMIEVHALRHALLFLLASIVAGDRAMGALDCNGNGMTDTEEAAAGESADCNGNGLPDECEGAPLAVGSTASVVLEGGLLALAAGDFNGDGLPDLAAATGNPERPELSVLRNAGSGEFEPAASFTAGPWTRRLATADLDGDGNLDLATLGDDGVGVFFNNGSPSFGAEVPVAARAGLVEFAVADLDGDETLDIVTTSADEQLLLVLLRGRDLVIEHDIADPSGVALADIDRDGAPDIVVVSATRNVSFLVNAGDGSFVLRETLPLIRGIRSLTAGDLDGDDLPDLALVRRSSVSVLLNAGGKMFVDGPSFHFDRQTTGDTSLGVGDLDLDGRADLLLGRLLPATQGEVLLLSGVDVSSSLPLRTPAPPDVLVVRDLDGDRRPEIVVGTHGRDRLEILRNDGGEDGLPSSRPRTREIVRLGQFEPHSTLLEDLDGDGDLDLATIDGEELVMVLLNDGTGGFEEDARYVLDGASELIFIAAVDLDNDDDLDIAAVDEVTEVLMVLHNQGDGSFVQLAENLDVSLHPVFIVAADVNGDGLNDLLTANEGASSVGIFVSEGDGTLASEQTVRVGGGPVALAPADLDGDRDIDLAVACSGSEELTILLNDGRGVFGARVDHDVPRPAYVVAADLDGDGDLDLAAAHENGEAVHLFTNSGGGEFSPGAVLEIGQPPNSLIASDVNRDGLVDLVTANAESSTISVVISRADGAFLAPFTCAVGQDPRYVIAGDVDADGRVEVISADHSAHAFSLLFDRLPDHRAPFLEQVCTPLDYHGVSVPSAAGGAVERTTHYMVPVDPGGDLLPPHFQNVRLHATQLEFLVNVFPERYGSLTAAGYEQLVARRASREYFTGDVHLLTGSFGRVHGFNVVVGPEPEERATLDEVRGAYEALRTVFTVPSLAYYPDGEGAREDARGWKNPGFPILFAAVEFRRGDATGDDAVNLTDAVVVLDFLFRAGRTPACLKAADANDDGRLNISDPAAVLLHLFRGHGPLPEPFGACGEDPTPDSISCAAGPPCAR